MSERNNIIICTDGISDEQKATKKFQSAYGAMLDDLTAPGFIPVLCAHEAAHFVYFSVAGATQFDYFSARLWYDPTIDDYKGQLAAIKPLDTPSWTKGEFNQWLWHMACALAAGGVVSRKLMPSSKGGDEDDKDRFKKLCDHFNTDPNVHIDFETEWSLAQNAIATALDDPAALATIQEHAAVIRPLLGL